MVATGQKKNKQNVYGVKIRIRSFILMSSPPYIETLTLPFVRSMKIHFLLFVGLFFSFLSFTHYYHYVTWCLFILGVFLFHFFYCRFLYAQKLI